MSKTFKLLPKITLWTLFAVSIVVICLFFGLGSDEVVINGTTWDSPKFTDLLLGWSYALCGLAIVVTLVAAVAGFARTFKTNPRKGLISLGVLVVFALVFVLSWFLGSADELKIIGYEGTDNVGFWAQYTDMCLFTSYILFIASLLAIVVAIVYSKVK